MNRQVQGPVVAIADAKAEHHSFLVFLQVAQLHEAVLARCPVGNTIKAPGVQYTLKFAKA